MERGTAKSVTLPVNYEYTTRSKNRPQRKRYSGDCENASSLLWLRHQVSCMSSFKATAIAITSVILKSKHMEYMENNDALKNVPSFQEAVL